MPYTPPASGGGAVADGSITLAKLDTSTAAAVSAVAGNTSAISANTAALTAHGVALASGIVAGEPTYPTVIASSSGVTMTSGQLILTRWVCVKTETKTQFTVWSGGTAATATPTLIRHGIYSVASDGAVTLIASHASDTTMYAAGVTAYTRSFTSSFNAVAGTVYYFGTLIVSGVAMPTIIGANVGSGVATLNLYRANIQLAGQTDLPSTISAATIAGAGNNPRMQYALILP